MSSYPRVEATPDEGDRRYDDAQDAAHDGDSLVRGESFFVQGMPVRLTLLGLQLTWFNVGDLASLGMFCSPLCNAHDQLIHGRKLLGCCVLISKQPAIVAKHLQTGIVGWSKDNELVLWNFPSILVLDQRSVHLAVHSHRQSPIKSVVCVNRMGMVQGMPVWLLHHGAIFLRLGIGLGLRPEGL